ncbi:HET-domain-containing protein [Apiospora rasikravindrae]|uniref:HET-domain-containing protein n=1 Tax=Apiospora rasikravindrae TaxID=990691 RepID=A0ABR1U0P4_9PEZI
MYLINIDTLELERFDVDPPRTPSCRIDGAMARSLSANSQTPTHGRVAYVWVDTCCIDKSSSAVLSEAINSMFAWYEGARVCYVLLDDVFADNTQDAESRSRPSSDDMAQSEWFGRGWTLQELIAPKRVKFFCKLKGGSQIMNWQHLGTRAALADQVAEITGIPGMLLRGQHRVSDYSVSRRMSWAAKRITTRPEDIAYCLMGLFGVNMPMLYGEGSKAFLRLQEEIMRTIDDDTLFAWTEPPSSDFTGFRGIFALSPNFFQGTGHFVPIPSIEPDSHMANTAKDRNLLRRMRPSYSYGKITERICGFSAEIYSK